MIHDEQLPDESILFLSDARGIYIPQDFATDIKHECVKGVSDAEWSILESGPDHELYQETWNDVEQNAIITDNGVEYCIFQDGDCWLVLVGAEWETEDAGETEDNG